MFDCLPRDISIFNMLNSTSTMLFKHSKIVIVLIKCSNWLFRMTPYRCLSTGNMVGLIEVVLDSSTLANIQKRKGGSVTMGAFDKTSLLHYIKECNPEEDRWVKPAG